LPRSEIAKTLFFLREFTRSVDRFSGVFMLKREDQKKATVYAGG